MWKKQVKFVLIFILGNLFCLLFFSLVKPTFAQDDLEKLADLEKLIDLQQKLTIRLADEKWEGDKNYEKSFKALYVNWKTLIPNSAPQATQAASEFSAETLGIIVNQNVEIIKLLKDIKAKK